MTTHQAPKQENRFLAFFLRLPTAIIFTGIALASVVSVLLTLYLTREGQQAQQGQQELSYKAQQGEGLADKVVIVCENAEILEQLRALGACDDAQEIKSSPPAVDIDAGIATAVEQYLRENPAVSASEVATAVADYLTKNPPKPGRAPTPEEIQRYVYQYLADHPEQFRGKDGQGATAAQISAAVATYCASATPSPCAGPAGPTGPKGEQGTPGKDGTPGEKGSDGRNGVDGVGVQDFYFARSSEGACESVTVYTNGTAKRRPAADVLCDGPPPPPGPEPGG